MPDISENPHVVSHRERLAAQASASSSAPMVDAAEAEATGLGQLLDALGPVAMFQTLAQLLPDAAVFVVDGQRNVRCWNPMAEQLLGFKRDQVLGQYCLTANRCYQCMLGCGLSEYGEVNDQPLVLLDVDGKPVHVRKTARAFFDDERRFLGGIEILVRDHAVEQPASEAAKRPEHQARSAPQRAAQPVLRRLPSPRTLSDEELKLKVEEALIRADGHIGKAAELLGVSRPTLWRWRKRFALADKD